MDVTRERISRILELREWFGRERVKWTLFSMMTTQQNIVHIFGNDDFFKTRNKQTAILDENNKNWKTTSLCDLCWGIARVATESISQDSPNGYTWVVSPSSLFSFKKKMLVTWGGKAVGCCCFFVCFFFLFFFGGGCIYLFIVFWHAVEESSLLTLCVFRPFFSQRW